ncbi:hypothetical protein JCGZ_10452 [Jatropha curcas]|uniref:Uncharacterized protein n=1 Tax=Jatropha curcas TaxID=180498 RepID=A0A067KID7_JATCU|nr:hypothetical protein JCGZ_10452 [Jatropha curcas]
MRPARCAVSRPSWVSLALAHLYHGLDVWTRGSGESNWQFLRPLEVYEYRIYPGGLGGDASADTRRIPRYLAHSHHTFSSFEDPHYWRCYLNDRALSDLLLTPWEGNAWEAYPARAVAEAYTQSRVLLQGYWLDRYFLGERIFELQVATAHVPVRGKKHRTPAYYRAQVEAEAEATAPAGPTGAVLGDVPFPPGMEVALDPALGLGLAIIIPADLREDPPPLQLDPEHATHDLEIGRLRRHQSRQSSAVTRL